MIENLDFNVIVTLIPIITTIIGGIAAINEKIKNKDLSGALNTAVGLYDSVMDAINPLTETTVVPDAIKTGVNSAIYKTTEKERNKITEGLPVAEKLAVLNYIDNKEEHGCNYYTIETSKGVYTIENGYIDDFVESTISTSSTSNAVSLNSDGEIVGSAVITSISSEGVTIIDGVSLNQSDFIGKNINVVFEGKQRGNVVVGAYFDGKLLGKNTFAVAYTNGKYDIENAVFRFPQYDSVMSVGFHTLEIKTGYVSGYSSYDGKSSESSGDQITWTTVDTYNININK